MPSGIHLTSEIKKEIADRLLSGEQIKLIQNDLNVSRMTIWRAAKKTGTDCKHRINERRNKGLSMIEKGESINSVASQLNVDRSTVIRWKKHQKKNPS